MIYPPISLYPGGAMMVCEDASEFDAEVAEPAAVVTAREQLSKIALESHTDPVLAILGMLEPAYHSVVEPAMRVGMNYTDIEEGIEKMEWVAKAMTAVVNSVRKAMLSGEAQASYYSSRFTSEPFMQHLGLFLKNATKVHQQGIETYPFQFSALNAFLHGWNLNGLVTSFTKNPALLEQMVTGNVLQALCGTESEPLTRNFDGFIDLMHCLFDDPERMARLEEIEARKLYFDELCASDRYGDDCNHVRHPIGEPSMQHQIFVMLGGALKRVSMGCYDTICELTDGTEPLQPGVYAERMRRYLNTLVNCFAIGLVHCMSGATNTRRMVATRNAVESYTELLLQTLKTV